MSHTAGCGVPRAYALRIISRSTITQLPDRQQPLPALAPAHTNTRTHPRTPYHVGPIVSDPAHGASV